MGIRVVGLENDFGEVGRNRGIDTFPLLLGSSDSSTV